MRDVLQRVDRDTQATMDINYRSVEEPSVVSWLQL